MEIRPPTQARALRGALFNGNANGPCKAQYEAAFETTNPQTIFLSADKIAISSVGSEGAVVTSLLQCLSFNEGLAPVSECFAPDSGDTPGVGDDSGAVHAGGDDAGDDANSP